MYKYLKLEDFNKYIDTNEYNKAYNKIINDSFKLIYEILKKKNIDINENILSKKDEKSFHYLIGLVEKNYISFDNIIFLMECFLNLNIDPDDDIGTTNKEKLQKCISRYNMLIDNLKKYELVDNKIKELGYKNVLKDRINELVNLFKEMLDYKKIKYDENLNFEESISLILKNYKDYQDILTNLLSVINTNIVYRDLSSNDIFKIKTNKTENIIYIDNVYNLLTHEIIGYKNNDENLN